MKEFVEKLIGRLEESATVYPIGYGCISYGVRVVPISETKQIINQLAKEYKEKDCSKCSRRSWYQKGYADAEKNNNWIPCSERLPEKETDVLVCFSNDMDCVIAYCTRMIEANYEDVWINSSTAHRITSNVIAWQPLPESYQSKEK